MPFAESVTQFLMENSAARAHGFSCIRCPLERIREAVRKHNIVPRRLMLRDIRAGTHPKQTSFRAWRVLQPVTFLSALDGRGQNDYASDCRQDSYIFPILPLGRGLAGFFVPGQLRNGNYNTNLSVVMKSVRRTSHSIAAKFMGLATFLECRSLRSLRH